jgi:hypothetical protein
VQGPDTTDRTEQLHRVVRVLVGHQPQRKD